MKFRKMVRTVGILGFVLQLSTIWGTAAAHEDTTIHNGDRNERTEGAKSAKHVTVVSIPGLSFQELRPDQLSDLPYFKEMTELGAVGAMNIRTANRSMRDVYASLGAGEPAVSNVEALAFEAKESRHGIRVSDLMNRYTGLLEGEKTGLLKEDSLIVPELATLKRLNKEQAYGVGALGDLLKTYGVHRTVLGSSDLGRGMHLEQKQLRRFAPLMLMDSNGIVDKGTLGEEAAIAAVDRASGVSTDYAHLISLWKSRQGPSITLIELGDLYRLYNEKTHYDQDRFNELKKRVLRDMDQWLGQLMEAMQPGKDSLWLFSPEVNAEAAKSKLYLSPILHYAKDGGAGMLVSESTRRQGVVTSQDFTSTLLNEFKIPIPIGLIGIPIASTEVSHALDQLVKDQSNMQMIYRSRPSLLYPFATFEMIVLLIALIYIVWIKRGGRKEAVPAHDVLRIVLLSLLTAPAIMLLLGWVAAPAVKQFGIDGAIIVLVCSFIVGSLLMAMILSAYSEITTMIWLGVGNAALIMLDACTGAHAMKYSVLGYDPMIGARYYGIGNEYMGVLIGALVLGVTAALQRRYAARGTRASRAAALAACAAFLLVTVCLTAPSLGANAGGALSAAVAFGVAGAQCFAGERWRELRLGRASALLAALLALGIGALWLLNSADSPAAFARESHVGRAFHALRAGQFDQIGHLIVRKLRMNVHLLRASVWSKVLITSLFVMAVLVLRPRGRLSVWQHKNPYWMYGFSANMIGAIAALLLNDSGIVAAATMIVFVAVPLLLLRLRELAAQPDA
ncbi:hypothetical protein HZF08_33400 [Paenibacillus sp. CGMCC 1.16610]|uniref:Uncharacterized protein n=1 Tax=Paenibacillus anseongense TaxID=2682845 RepID=A0ABW9U369_9BACL|nr:MULTISPECIES: hypothetical protein [Paenibacillus]MBA2943168.1 hypothetical protein [Paenibacillus sp. CGMCC 1.16610]MVQ33665.1 hypothetical protein [Paenibacillus anseongense]